MKQIDSTLGYTYRSLKCPTPITIRVGDNLLNVGCGNCAYCKSALRLVWNFRLNSCLETSDLAFFSTLTYSDDNLSGYFDKKYIQSFHKRLRKRLRRLGWSMKFYLISEYGSRTLRPHLHSIYFLYPVKVSSDHSFDFPVLVDSEWRKGFSLTQPVTSQRIGYITHYHVRPKFPYPLSKKTHRRPFVMCSQNLGAIDPADIVIDSDGFPLIYDKFNAHWIVLPSYHRRKFNILLPDLDLAAPNRVVNTPAQDKRRLYLKRQFYINYNTESF